MTRPKVPEDKRQRTAQACDTCKRRKQKVSTCLFYVPVSPPRSLPETQTMLSPLSLFPY
ncbi:uncharacterized protein CTRU02_212717 [Colletotrichum truncatum]|uniref:Uncharacterized protein n=1 Tax=Colletotrichum truncatum TaxID=5467 RepID=A0ACC3YIN1_COLTU|nr:uncharacterized protein CTRU02_05206 [Colletotrichum truncatum]KAF6794374.1 hypothetical protein CTRU02_05206 [Colletotrichum truncatum]